MTNKFLIITVLTFLAFLIIAPQITTGGIWVAVAAIILLGIMFMSLNYTLKSDKN